MLVLQDQEWLSVWGERSAHSHTRQVDEQPTKRSKTNNDKSAVAMLKKGKLARKRICLRCLSRSNGATCDKEVMRNWDEIHLNVSFLMHDNWVAYFRT